MANPDSQALAVAFCAAGNGGGAYTTLHNGPGIRGRAGIGCFTEAMSPCPVVVVAVGGLLLRGCVLLDGAVVWWCGGE